MADAPDQHVRLGPLDPIGGYVCSSCGTPTETEPCQIHQPDAYNGGPPPDRIPGTTDITTDDLPEVHYGCLLCDWTTSGSNDTVEQRAEQHALEQHPPDYPTADDIARWVEHLSLEDPICSSCNHARSGHTPTGCQTLQIEAGTLHHCNCTTPAQLT